MFDTIKIMLDTMIHLSQCFHCYGHWDYDIAIVKILRYGNLLTNTEIKDKLVKQDEKSRNKGSLQKKKVWIFSTLGGVNPKSTLF